VRVASFEVLLNSTQLSYSLSNSDNVGLPTDAIILGFNLENNAQPLFGTTPMDDGNRQSSYFTLKQGTNAFIDQFPCGITDYSTLINSLDYMPIVPTQVMAIDWQQSKLEIRDNAAITNGMVFQFSLIWWSTNCE
jgi:hypothetical protein